MKKELEYYRIGTSYGGSQDWFLDPMMKIGGCAAIVACETCIYFDKFRGTSGLYPYDKERIERRDFTRFGMKMKPYLSPRWSGIDTLDIYMDGFGKYLSDVGCSSVRMEPLYGDERYEKAQEAVVDQIDRGFLIPCLLLRHRDAEFDDYEWHWFFFTGYAALDTGFKVKAVTYGYYRWMDLKKLWDTGHMRKGGLILYRQE